MIVTAVMAIALGRKTVLDVNVVSDRNPLYVQLSDGSIRNGYTVRILNKLYQTRTYTLRVEGLPDAHVVVAGQEGVAQPKVDVAADDMKPVKVFVSVPQSTVESLQSGQASFTFIVHDEGDNTETRRITNFRGTEK